MITCILLMLIIDLSCLKTSYCRSMLSSFTYDVQWMYSHNAKAWKNWDLDVMSNDKEIWYMGLFTLTHPPDTFASVDVLFSKAVPMDITLNDVYLWYNRDDLNYTFLLKSSNIILKPSHNTLIFHQKETSITVNFRKPVLVSEIISGCFPANVTSIKYLENFTVEPSYSIKAEFYKNENLLVYSSISQIVIEIIQITVIPTLNIFGGMSDNNLTLLYKGEIRSKFDNSNLNHTEMLFRYYVIEFTNWNNKIYESSIKNISFLLCSESESEKSKKILILSLSITAFIILLIIIISFTSYYYYRKYKRMNEVRSNGGGDINSNNSNNNNNNNNNNDFTSIVEISQYNNNYNYNINDGNISNESDNDNDTVNLRRLGPPEKSYKREKMQRPKLYSKNEQQKSKLNSSNNIYNNKRNRIKSEENVCQILYPNNIYHQKKMMLVQTNIHTLNIKNPSENSILLFFNVLHLLKYKIAEISHTIQWKDLQSYLNSDFLKRIEMFSFSNIDLKVLKRCSLIALNENDDKFFVLLQEWAVALLQCIPDDKPLPPPVE